jgi:2-(1,2-epoxy-1,2-dihydrophenyl)acetyl-CoA isomerase
MTGHAAPPAVLTSRSDNVLHIRLNRPAVLNALDAGMVVGLQQALARARAEAGLRVVVLSGEGRGFMAGGDIAMLAGGPAGAAALLEPFHQVLRDLAALDQPVIARLHGPVAGAGMSLALACDLAIASEDAVFTYAYSRIGTSPDGSLSWTLPRLVGLRRALEIALLSDPIDAAAALRLGLVNRVVPAQALDEAVTALAARLAHGPTQAFGRTRRLLRAALSRDLPAQMDAEMAEFLASAGTEDFREGVTAFLARRVPRFEGS